MTREEKKALLQAFKEFVQDGVFSVDTELRLNQFGYEPEFLEVLFDSGWTAARMIRMEA